MDAAKCGADSKDLNKNNYTKVKKNIIFHVQLSDFEYIQNYKLETHLKTCIWNNLWVGELKVTKILSQYRENCSTYCSMSKAHDLITHHWYIQAQSLSLMLHMFF